MLSTSKKSSTIEPWAMARTDDYIFWGEKLKLIEEFSFVCKL